MFCDDAQPRFGQQEMDVGHPAMQRIFNGDNRACRRPVLNCVNGIFKRKAGERQAFCVEFQRRQMRIRPRRALKGHGARGVGGSGGGHVVNFGKRGGGITVHDGGSDRGPPGCGQDWISALARLHEPD